MLGGMTVSARVLGVGAALGSLRLRAADVAVAWGDRGGRGSVPVCADDEDGLTLAWAAAVDALGAAAVQGADVDGLWWGTSRPPYAEGPNHAMLAAALGLPRRSTGVLAVGSPHAGMEALLGAWDAVASGSVATALVVVSDDLRPGLGTAWERRAGSGAAALLLSAQGGTALLTGRTTRTDPVLDRYRGDGESEAREVYDGRLFREQVFLPLLAEVVHELAADAPLRAWSLPDPDGRLGRALARRTGVDHGAERAYSTAGDTGAAAALLGALPALARAGTVGLLGFGGGRATGVAVEVEAPVPGARELVPAGRETSYAEVLRARGQLVPNGEQVAMGIPPGSAGFVRGAREVLQLLGARCADCATVNTPPSVHPHCASCGRSKLEDVALARAGTVHTFVVNHTMPAPFVAPLPLAVLDLDDGARVMLQVTDGPAVAASLAVGDRVRLVLRRYAVERGAPVYGYKAEREQTS